MRRPWNAYLTRHARYRIARAQHAHNGVDMHTSKTSNQPKHDGTEMPALRGDIEHADHGASERSAATSRKQLEIPP